MLVGWAAGPIAKKYAGWETRAVVDRAVASLSSLLDMDATSLLEGWHMHDWHADPFARGAYSFITVGGADAPEQFARPTEDTLYFAGEATNTDGHGGTVHGAIATGERAARQILS